MDEENPQFSSDLTTKGYLVLACSLLTSSDVIWVLGRTWRMDVFEWKLHRNRAWNPSRHNISVNMTFGLQKRSTTHMEVSIVMGVAQNGWFIMGYSMAIPTKMDDNWGYPYFRKPPYEGLKNPIPSSRRSDDRTFVSEFNLHDDIAIAHPIYIYIYLSILSIYLFYLYIYIYISIYLHTCIYIYIARYICNIYIMNVVPPINYPNIIRNG